MTTPNYKESSLVGTKWRRAYSATISNPYNDPSNMRVSFQEEDVVELPDTTIVNIPIGSVEKSFSPEQSFPLRNPTTNSVIGSMTHAEFYAILYSLYMSLALERDGE